MATQKQIEANRQNSQKSTGPKTAEGKAAVSQNALRHGLFAAGAVITGENPADYLAYHDQMLAELAPVGEVETMLAERVVGLSWRLKRAERMQNEYFDNLIETEVTNPSAIRSWENDCRDEGIKPDDPKFASDHLTLGRVANRDWRFCRILERLLLYERRIENSLYKTLNRLKQYQVIRRIELDEARKHQPAQAIPKACGFEAATRPAYNLSDLKKQSQFAAAHLTAKPLMIEDYGNNPAAGIEENKADQSQFLTPAPSKEAKLSSGL